MLYSFNRVLFQDLKCPHCEKMFCTKNYRDKHVDVIHHGIKRYCCDLCPYKAGAKSNLTRHLFSSHSELFTQCTQWSIMSHNEFFTQLSSYLTWIMVKSMRFLDQFRNFIFRYRWNLYRLVRIAGNDSAPSTTMTGI